MKLIGSLVLALIVSTPCLAKPASKCTVPNTPIPDTTQQSTIPSVGIRMTLHYGDRILRNNDGSIMIVDGNTYKAIQCSMTHNVIGGGEYESTDITKATQTPDEIVKIGPNELLESKRYSNQHDIWLRITTSKGTFDIHSVGEGLPNGPEEEKAVINYLINLAKGITFL